MPLCALVVGLFDCFRTGRRCRQLGGLRTERVQFRLKTKPWSWLWPVLLLSLTALPLIAHADTRREARGWLELEQDQTSYRERVAPLDLREQRQLEVIERSQRNDLRALQQRQQREVQFERQSTRRAPNTDVPRRDPFQPQRRAVERLRLRIQMQQDGLPYGQ